MNKYMENSIVSHAWHQFLYGYNGGERKEFLQKMSEDYPVILDSDEPVAVYIDDYSLPIVENPKECDSYQKLAIAREHFSIVMIEAIINQSMQQVELSKLNERMITFIKAVNRLMMNSGESVLNLEEFLKVLEDAKKFYSDEYVKLLSTGKFQGDINSLKIGFVDLNTFAKYYKQALGMKSHFAVLIDQQRTGAKISQKAVNGVISRRCAGNLAMKVACEPQEWSSFYDLNGQLVEYVHDFSVVELDDCYSKYVKKLTRKFTEEN